jgi:hypothetical protein
MIDAEAAIASAEAALADLRQQRDPMLLPWGEVSAGDPVLVHDVGGSPAYWLVPVRAERRAIGFARIDGRGRVAAIGITCRTPDRIAACPRLVTGLSAAEATAKALAEGGLAPGETLGEPRYVHDGPPGREAWLVETRLGGRPSRWIFVSAAGCYSRPAGVRHGEDPGAE